MRVLSLSGNDFRLELAKTIVRDIRCYDDQKIQDAVLLLYPGARPYTKHIAKAYATKLCMMVLEDKDVEFSDKILEKVHTALDIEELKSRSEQLSQKSYKREMKRLMEKVSTLGMF